METAKLLKTQPKTAFSNDLYSINYCVFQLPGTSDFSAMERRYLFFLISLVKSGFSEIRAPMGVIADAIFRAQGQTKSVSTLRSAFRALESKGYLVRRKFRTGVDRGGAVISLNLERFVFWTQIQRRNISPLPTSSHNSSCHQNLVGDDRRNMEGVVNSQNSSDKRKLGSRARTCSKNSAKIKKYHPIVYTLICVLPPTPEKSKMLSIARREIVTGDSSHTGIDWPYYAGLWPALDPNPGGRREVTARREIVPLLYRALKGDSGAGMEHTADPPVETVDDIRELIERSLKSVSLGGDGDDDPNESPEEISLTEEELHLLNRAKNVVKYDG